TRPNVAGELMFMAGSAGWKWFSTFVIMAVTFTLNRSVARTCLPTVLSTFQRGKPRRMPDPPPFVSTPRINRRNCPSAAAGFLHHVEREAALCSKQWRDRPTTQQSPQNSLLSPEERRLEIQCEVVNEFHVEPVRPVLATQVPGIEHCARAPGLDFRVRAKRTS